jgi:CheY-like chemotaxis protein
MRILVVEDDAILALVAAEALTIFGHEVIGPAYSAETALQFAATQSLDLAFIDINLAGHDEGITLARDLRTRYGLFSVFISGQIAVARSNRDAAIGLLRKPYRLEDLNRSAEFAQALIAGQNPPPPPMPSALEVFQEASP